MFDNTSFSKFTQHTHPHQPPPSSKKRTPHKPPLTPLAPLKKLNPIPIRIRRNHIPIKQPLEPPRQIPRLPPLKPKNRIDIIARMLPHMLEDIHAVGDQAFLGGGDVGD